MIGSDVSGQLAGKEMISFTGGNRSSLMSRTNMPNPSLEMGSCNCRYGTASFALTTTIPLLFACIWSVLIWLSNWPSCCWKMDDGTCFSMLQFAKVSFECFLSFCFSCFQMSSLPLFWLRLACWSSDANTIWIGGFCPLALVLRSFHGFPDARTAFRSGIP